MSRGALQRRGHELLLLPWLLLLLLPQYCIRIQCNVVDAQHCHELAMAVAAVVPLTPALLEYDEFGRFGVLDACGVDAHDGAVQQWRTRKGHVARPNEQDLFEDNASAQLTMQAIRTNEITLRDFVLMSGNVDNGEQWPMLLLLLLLLGDSIAKADLLAAQQSSREINGRWVGLEQRCVELRVQR